MRRNPERIAWIFLITAGLLFCLIVVGVPLGVRHFLLTSQHEQKALVESISGTVVVEPPLGRGAIPLSKGESMSVPEGTLVRADETSEAVITFYDHSFMRVFAGTTVRLEQMTAKRYSIGRVPNVISLALVSGRLQIGTAISTTTPLEFIVSTFQSKATLAPDGSYSLEADNVQTDISTYRGQASIEAQGQIVSLSERQRTTVEINQPPHTASSMARDLLANGTLADPIAESWSIFNDQGTDGGIVDGTASVVVDEGRRAYQFNRTGGYGNHCETGLEQVLNRQLPDPMTSLSIRATLKVKEQSLSGGGYLSSEYPLIIRLTYRDAYDNEAEWVQGFYIQNTANYPTTYGQQIPQDRWYFYDSGNLLEQLPVRPYKLIRVRVYASGWDYTSLLSDIALVVE
ncbi:MAG: hypothetical protein LLG44_08705 [Chloroflexi bacterium]|nr:hypothetical protein [Chloroflexota bacterium]